MKIASYIETFFSILNLYFQGQAQFKNPKIAIIANQKLNSKVTFR